ncbi:DNA-binding protein [Clostridium butyricum]|uniref:DNA-binding protein n=1 Tax=Clostridium butyricum TaxID=1492 RepID=UPI00168AB300|nr:DNA-binding protein [Clostridium butyricum]MDB2154142.1 DNA-binding protein [Clostridium butyricum]
MNNFTINNSINYTNTDLIDVYSNNKISNKNSDIENTTPILNDSLELDPDKKNIINKINANKAFKKTSEDMELSKEEEINLRLEYARIRDQMRDHGYNVPDFDLNNFDPKTSSFLPFLSEMKNFSNSYFSSGDHLVSSDFFGNFCDKFEENLKKYDCF